MFRFAYPYLFFLLAAVAGWLFFLFRRRRLAITYSLTSTLARLSGGGGRIRSRLPVALRTVTLVLLLLAAARPQLYNVSREVRTPGVDIVLALDTSGSMRALDFKIDGDPVTRLTAVKKVVGEFIEKRRNDRIGLVVFGDEAFTQAPLTFDKGLLLGLVEKMEVGMAGDRTAIGSAVAIAGKRLKDVAGKSKIIILLTDGRHNAGEVTPVQAAEAVHAVGVKVYTVGVGGKGPAPFAVDTIFGRRLVEQLVDLDEETLTAVARLGGGRYFRAGDSERLAEIYDIIDREEKTEAKVKEFFHFRELYHFFLIPALFFMGLEILVRASRLRVLP